MPLIPRPNCACCDRDLPNGDLSARICSFECTFWPDCAEHRLGGACPNRGGDLVPRRTRPAAMPAGFPASASRVLGQHPACLETR